MAEAEPFLADGNQELFPCEVCGRCFAADVLERHGPICRKLFNKKRKAFNSLKQRLQGTDIPTVWKASQSKPQPMRKSNWRQQHEDFINAIRSAKQGTLAIKEGRPLPPPPTPSINLDYIQCPYCMRRFNETAANRHINFCKDQSSRRVFDPAQAAAKLASRVQGRVQMSPEKGTTVTSAVGALLQNRAQEASVVPTRPAVDPTSGAKFRQGFTKSSKKRLTPRGQERGMILHFDLEGYCPVPFSKQGQFPEIDTE
ncbi:LOW QUALITY PROTEIN: zinc finger C2HC domain-containing protein 1B [Balaenoptera ricei]|uniref:LOW QUALITY PROTEIN: zinc finger C2HC domain-containing protein 1B n=1 Tax=Balaenoptera ricei TaxID=2746895 RepID=UPI0028BF520F|nr:LOW QUALITY PROTEIN: zinc finger C2HC domain-containing protein 1B [Balaenoptera ricei]